MQEEQQQDLTKSEKVKKHFEKHKNTYIFVGIGAVSGVVLGVAIGKKARPVININNAPVVNVPVNNVANASNNLGGYSTKIVECLETGEIWKSVKDAAESVGVSASNMSKHLNGAKPDIYGKTYAILGLGTTGVA